MYYTQLDARAFSTNVACLRTQLSEVVLAIPAIEWYGTDVDAPGKILFMDESPILLGSSKQLAGLVSGAGQFVSGVFLAFHVGDVPRFRSVIGTEDKQGASLCNALVEFRTIDTSWIEITSISREILLHAFSRYEMIKISEL